MTNEIEAYLYGEKIGTLIEDNRIIYFRYSTSFKILGLEISPLKLHTKKTSPLYVNKEHEIYEGLAGVFYDSLPDSYGMSIMDRYFESKGFNPNDLSLINRLMFIGDRGMGAIEYKPQEHDNSNKTSNIISITGAYKDMKNMITGENTKSIPELMNLIDSASPAGGGRPKMLVFYNKETKELMFHSEKLPEGFSRYILKFDEFRDDFFQNSKDFTKFEYLYMQMAKECGINIPHIEVIEDDIGLHFLIKRFDRDENDEKVHIATASALLHNPIDITNSTSYEDLFNLTKFTTKSPKDIKELYRRTVFNILSLNNDCHAKNFSFMMDKKGNWSLSPAYDITYSYGVLNKEQAMKIKGKGKNFTKQDLLYMAKKFSIQENEAIEIINKTKEVLSTFEKKAKELNISTPNINGCWLNIKDTIAFL